VTARLVPLVLLLLAAAPAARAASDATEAAKDHYKMGLSLFEQREHEQALIEFQQANELKSVPAAVFMMAQCEYLLGRLKEARAHYELYKKESPGGEFAKLAEGRIQSIDRRQSTFVINTVPDDVTISIAPDGKPEAAVTGQAPNNFQIPRGRYKIDATKPNYQGQTRVVDVDIAETKPLFFKLDPIPARLEIETAPSGATLYVNGNRARNPYRQDVVPGHYEVFAEAGEHEPRTIDLTLAPGERRLLTGDQRLSLPYIQRSGRPELLLATALVGGLVGAGAVIAAIGTHFDTDNVNSVLLAGGGGLTGIVAGALVATRVVPDYITDNRALFILGSMWLGLAEGAGVGIVGRQILIYSGDPVAPCPYGSCRGSVGEQLRDGFIGSLPGLALGLTTGSLLSDRAPTYGRAALIQSAALGGALTGVLVQVATQWKPYGSGWEYSVRYGTTDPDNKVLCAGSNATMDRRCSVAENSVLDRVPAALIGLNAGLLAGVLGAYLPDQSKYGPSWKRVLLVDLAAVAGVVAGGVAGCVANVAGCLTSDSPHASDYAIAATTALAGGALGAVAGVLLTRHIDDAPAEVRPTTTVMGALMPVRTADGGTAPGVGALGTF
jgi:hypothetical protein